MHTDEHHGIIPWEKPDHDECVRISKAIEEHREKENSRDTIRRPLRAAQAAA